MFINEIAKRAQKFAIDNSPSILTTIGVVGTFTTAVLAGKAAYKAYPIIQKERVRISLDRTGEPDNAFDVDRKDAFLLTWKLFVPPVGSAVLTCGAIVFANRIGGRRAAAVAAAYTISERAFTEYREKVVEKLGAKQDQVVRDEIAQDRIDKNPVSQREVIIAGGEVLCYDKFSDRYFKSDIESIKKAQNDTNYQILAEDGYASLGDFYGRIGLDGTAFSEEVGWNTEKRLEVLFSTTMSDDQRPCIVISFRLEPIRGYDRMR